MGGFHKYRIGAVALAAASALFSITTPASASVEISTNPTANMTCSGGVCSPTAANAVLNAGDLATMLASGDVKVTTGSGATNIVVKTSLGWSSANRLTLDAMQSVEIEKPVMVTGTGGVTVTTDDGGSGGDLMFDGKGAVTFWDLSSSLIVNGNSYTLVNDIATLASDITANPSGFYALANDYDASVDGTYTSAPIATEVTGTVEGLGHAISNLTINSALEAALFDEASGTLRDIGLTKATVSADANSFAVGTLLALSDKATIVGCFASGTVISGSNVPAGGLVGRSRFSEDGTITRSHASVKVSGGDGSTVGGLVGISGFSISLSYATGTVTASANSFAGGLWGAGGNKVTQSFTTGKVKAGSNSSVGGLIGFGGGTIQNSYATGAVKSGDDSETGGLVGNVPTADITGSYATGHVSGNPESQTGGLLGGGNEVHLSDDYWDTSTTGKSGHQGCNNRRCGGQSKGRTTEQLQSGLPAGFDPNIWGETGGINGGLPYLLALPPK